MSTLVDCIKSLESYKTLCNNYPQADRHFLTMMCIRSGVNVHPFFRNPEWLNLSTSELLYNLHLQDVISYDDIEHYFQKRILKYL